MYSNLNYESKVFEGIIQPEWRAVVAQFNVFTKLATGQAIDYSTYEKIHRKQLKESVLPPTSEFVIKQIGTEGARLGARYYAWKGAKYIVN